MPKHKYLLEKQFVVWVLGGFLVLVLGPITLRDNAKFCVPATPIDQRMRAEPTEQTAEGIEAGDAINSARRDNRKATANRPEEDAVHVNRVGHEEYRTVWYCDLRLTDVALVYLTFCLALVSWVTMRSSKRTAEFMERAYVFPGHGALAFKGSEVTVTFTMTNRGRMPAGIKEAGYKFLNCTELPGRREDADWEWTRIEYDWVIPPSEKKVIATLNSPLQGDQVFVGYVKYEDILTREMHTCWMGLGIFPREAEERQARRAGGDAWNDWD